MTPKNIASIIPYISSASIHTRITQAIPGSFNQMGCIAKNPNVLIWSMFLGLNVCKSGLSSSEM